MLALARLWRMALLLSGLLLLPVLLIRAQPYEASGVQTGLQLSSDCPAPCVMGIRPGVTSESELIAILRRHPWVVPGSFGEGSSTALAWQWSEAAPAWINPQRRGSVGLYEGRVHILVIETTINWGDLVLAFGWPDRYRMVSAMERLPDLSAYHYQHQAWYAARHMAAVADVYCLDERHTLYDWPVVLQFQGFAASIWPAPRALMTNCR